MGASIKDRLGVHFLRVPNIPIRVNTSCLHLGEGRDKSWRTLFGSGFMVTLPDADVTKDKPAKIVEGPM